VGKDTAGSSQYWYVAYRGYLQYSNDGVNWATAWMANFDPSSSAGYVKQEVVKPTENPVRDNTPVLFDLGGNTDSTAAYSTKGYQIKFFSERFITKLYPGIIEAINARVYIVLLVTTGATVDTVLYDSGEIALSVGQVLDIPPLFVQPGMRYGVVVQRVDNAALGIRYRSVKTLTAHAETQGQLRYNTAGPIVAGTAMEAASASPYTTNFTHEGVQ
jgi:hypothetical protein